MGLLCGLCPSHRGRLKIRHVSALFISYHLNAFLESFKCYGGYQPHYPSYGTFAKVRAGFAFIIKFNLSH